MELFDIPKSWILCEKSGKDGIHYKRENGDNTDNIYITYYPAKNSKAKEDYMFSLKHFYENFIDNYKEKQKLYPIYGSKVSPDESKIVHFSNENGNGFHIRCTLIEKYNFNPIEDSQNIKMEMSEDDFKKNFYYTNVLKLGYATKFLTRNYTLSINVKCIDKYSPTFDEVFDFLKNIKN